MITGYKPTVKDVLERFFKICDHSIIGERMNGDKYCQECDSLVSAKEVHDVEELRAALYDKNIEISGGIFVGKLLKFITNHSTLFFNQCGSKKWHSLCMEIPTDLGGAFFYTRSDKSFAWNICWLADIVYNMELNKGRRAKELREEINE